MRKILVLSAVAATMLLVGPASALTLQQAQAELAGMSCSGSSCTSDETITTENQLPDVVTSSEELVAPATSEGASYPDQTSPAADYKKGGWWNEKCQTFAYVNKDCTVASIAPNGGGTSAIYKTVTIVTPGGIETVVTCETTTKTLSYNGPFTSRDQAWSVDTSTSSSDGAC